MPQRLKANRLRKFGLDLVGGVPWGTHLCQFYETKEDLIDILVPYFTAGLRNNEFCMWITSPPLEVEEAKAALRKVVPDLDEYVQKGQIEVLSYTDWYLLGGTFDSDRVLQGWVEKEKTALSRGFSGLRLTGNTFWLERKDWKAFTDYEEAVNNVIGKHSMIAICTYSLTKCNANEIIDVIKNHQFALIKRRGKWELIESAEKKKIAEDLRKTEKKFTALYNSMTEGVALHSVVYDKSEKAVDYIITDVNPSFERITGLSRKQAVGKKASELYGTGSAPYLDIYEKVASSGKPASFETYFPPMQKHFSISVFSPSKGKFNTVFYDITEAKQAEEALRASERRWVTTLSSIGDAVIATDIEGNIMFMNHIAEGLTGWALTEASKKPLKEVFHIVNEHTRKEVENPVAKVLEKGLIIGLANHTLLIRKDGTEIPIDDSGAPIRDENGRISGVVLVFRDIAERRKMESELSNLAKFPSENPNIIIRLSSDGKLLYANPGSQRLLGDFLEALDQSLPEKWREYITKALSSGEKIRFEEQISGLTYTFLVAPIVSEGYVNIYGEDITERKQIEQAMLQAKNEWELTFNSVPDLIAVLDDQHRIVRANRAMAQRLGVTPEQCIGKKCYECVHGSSLPPEFCPHAQTLQDGQEHVAVVHEDRIGGDFLVSTTPLIDEKGQMSGSVHVARDITKQKQTEQLLRESQHDLNRAQAVAKTGSWRLDTQRNVLLWSEENHRIFGIPKGTPMTYETFLSTVHLDDREYVDRMWKAGLRGEPYDIEHRIVVNGKVRWVRERAELEFNRDGLLLGGFGTTQDITERKQTEQELFDTLKESQRRQSEISALLKASRAVLQNREFRYSARAIFDSCKELLGATAGYVALLSEDGKENVVLFLESGGLPCSVDPSLPMPIRGLRAEAYKTGKVAVENDFPKSEWSKLMPSGHVALENVLFAPLNVEGKTLGIIGLANKPGGFTERDAQMALAFGEIASIALINSQMLELLEDNAKKLKTHSEHLEELVEEKTKQLKDAERLATIGETAGMIGHDIRNPLQAIICELYLAKDSLHSLPESDARESLKESMHVVEEQATYINKIVTDLQDYAKQLAPFIEETDLEKTIEATITTMDIPENIKVTYSIEKEFPKLMIDASYLKRMVTNLVSNAVQAMPNGGKLTINASCKNQRVIVNVEDTGEGIPEEAKNKIFKPLFTTKAKGQGFGLAVVKKLTEALNGTITFESEKGKGTKFTIEFPADCRNHANHIG